MESFKVGRIIILTLTSQGGLLPIDLHFEDIRNTGFLFIDVVTIRLMYLDDFHLPPFITAPYSFTFRLNFLFGTKLSILEFGHYILDENNLLTKPSLFIICMVEI